MADEYGFSLDVLLRALSKKIAGCASSPATSLIGLVHARPEVGEHMI